MSDNLEYPESRAENILHDMLGADFPIKYPQSRIEKLLIEILNNGGGGAGGIVIEEAAELYNLADGAYVLKDSTKPIRVYKDDETDPDKKLELYAGFLVKHLRKFYFYGFGAVVGGIIGSFKAVFGTIQASMGPGGMTYNYIWNSYDITDTVDSTSTDSQLPTAKSVYDAIQAALYVNTSDVIIPAESNEPEV